jgi:ABC-type multidrug transport system fused ATPase/permease subunit
LKFVSLPGTVIGFLPAMAPILRGGMTGEQCWFILMNREFVLATTVLGIIPVFIVLILYSIILYRAIKKVNELKKATSGSNGTETANNLRYFKGSTVNLRQIREQEAEIPLREKSKRSLRCCCSKSKTSERIDTETSVATVQSANRQPSKWKAVKIVILTTGSFVVTWLPYFIASTMYVYCDHEHNPNFCNGLKVAVASPLAILGFANSLLNPIIYAWWHNGFRTNSIRIFSRRFECCRRCFKKTDENISSPRLTNVSSSTTILSSQSPTTSTAMASNNNIAVPTGGSDLRDGNDIN